MTRYSIRFPLILVALLMTFPKFAVSDPRFQVSLKSLPSLKVGKHNLKTQLHHPSIIYFSEGKVSRPSSISFYLAPEMVSLLLTKLSLAKVHFVGTNGAAIVG